jgi:hypothetical protein
MTQAAKQFGLERMIHALYPALSTLALQKNHHFRWSGCRPKHVQVMQELVLDCHIPAHG